MKHIARIAALALAALALLPLAAQTSSGGSGAATSSGQAETGSPNAASIGVDTAQQKLKEVSVDKFEQPGFWVPMMSSDEGIITDRLFVGSPAGKANEPLADERLLNIDNKVADTQVLGVRVDYLRRGFNSFEIIAKKPLPIEGITKTVSVWVAGRNFNHTLKILILDSFGRRFELPMGTLNFQGWKKLSVAIPPQSSDGYTGIVQRNYHYNTHMGIKILGFRVECDPLETIGTYYVYFDDLRAVTDLFAEDSKDTDDMADAW